MWVIWTFFLSSVIFLFDLPLSGRRPDIDCNIVGQGATALVVDKSVGYLDIFSLICHFSLRSPSLWETARYRLQYYLKWPLNPKQPTNGRLRGGRVVRWCWVNFQCRGVLQFDYSRARAFCACSRCGWGWFGHFTLIYPFSSFSLSLGDGPI